MKSEWGTIRASLFAGAALLAMPAGGVWAQSDADASEAEDDVISVITVTARKREEALEDVPIAITNFSEEAIRDSSSRNIADFLQNSPGLSITDGGGGLSTISLRGVSTGVGGNAVGYYLDEVPFTGVTVPTNPDVRSFDLNRVEVLRGPQGTLFGEGSQGGTIRIITNDPNTDRIEARAEGFYGFTDGGEDTYGVRAMANVPIIEDVFAIRGVIVQEEEGGFIDIANPGDVEDNINDQELTNWRVKARLTPTDNLDIVASYWSYDNNIDSTANANDDFVVSERSPAGLEYEQYSARVSYDLPFGNLFYAFGNTDFLLARASETPGFGTFTADLDIEVQSHEARFSGEVLEGLNLTIGYFRREAERFDLVEIPSVLLAATATITSNADAIFGELEYAFTDRLRFAAGLRYFDETLISVEGGTGFGGVPTIIPEVNETSEDFSPRFILSYDVSEDLLLFASAARGFRGAQPQPGALIPLLDFLPEPPPPALSPDSIWTFELGGKMSMLDGRLILDGAVYYSDWDDRAVRLPIPGTGISALTASDGLEIFGLELAGSYEPVDGLILQAAASYVDSDNKSDVPGTEIMEGDPAEDVSDFTFNASVLYRKPVTDTLDGFARVALNYATERDNPTLITGTGLPSDNILQLDARVGVEAENWGIYLYGDNLTNEDGAVNLQFLGAGGEFQGVRLRPRTIGIEVSVNY